MSIFKQVSASLRKVILNIVAHGGDAGIGLMIKSIKAADN